MATNKISTKAKVIMICCALLMPVFLILPLVFYSDTAKGEDGTLSVEAQKQNTAPVGKLMMPGEQAVVAAPAAVAYQEPETVYANVCAACHDSGLLGAPKKGDQAAWEARIAEAGGFEGVVKIAIAGKGSMPPKGGASISDENFADVVAFVSGQAVEKKAEAAPAESTATEAETATEASVDEVVAENTEAADTTNTETAEAATTANSDASADEPSSSENSESSAEQSTETTEVAVAEADSSFDAAAEYDKICKVCHDIGLAGAPKKGDKAAWDAKIEAAGGEEGMIALGIKGTGTMPPKGGAAISDADFAKVVEFMMQ